MVDIKILQGDCLERLEEIPNESIDLVVIDPPYLTTKECWDKKEVVNERLVQQLYRVCKDTASVYVWCGIGEKSQSLLRWFPIFEKDFYFKDLITWQKQRGIGMRKGWLYCREECMWFVVDNKKFVWNEDFQYTKERRVYTPNPEKCKSEFKRITNVWTDIKEASLQGGMGQVQVKGHFTPKPVEAIERILKCHVRPGDTVLDCFAGSGTTLIAAMRVGVNVIGIEKDERFVELIKARIEGERRKLI